MEGKNLEEEYSTVEAEHSSEEQRLVEEEEPMSLLEALEEVPAGTGCLLAEEAELWTLAIHDNIARASGAIPDSVVFVDMAEGVESCVRRLSGWSELLG